MEGYCSLASGSKGNSTYFGTKKTKILIDAGISGRATKKRLAQIGVDIEEIQGILISHPHADHIQGLITLAFRYGIPILANAATAEEIYYIFKQCPQFKIFTTGEPFVFGDIEIHPFSVQHDTVDPVAFTLNTHGIKMGICTDLGYPTTLVRTHLGSCQYLILEANHEIDWVHSCGRPIEYKQRVLGRNGHLSNQDAANLLIDIKENLKQIHLAHLSSECNSHQKALESVKEKIGDAISLSIAPQDQCAESVLF